MYVYNKIILFMENFVLLVFVLLIISNIIFYISKLINFTPILGLILIGIFSSTNYFKKFINPNKTEIEYLGDFGIIVLMFVLGYESSLNKIKKNKKDTIIISIISFIFPFILGFFSFKLLGYDTLTSFVVGLVLSITAEVINGKILVELSVLNTDIGSTIIGVGLIDSFIGIIILSILMFNYGKLNKDIIVSISLIISYLLGIKYKYISEKDDKKLKLNDKKIKIMTNVALKTIAPFFFITMGYNLNLTNLTINNMIIVLLIIISIFGKVGGSLISKPFVDYSLKQLSIIGWGINSRGAIDLSVVLLAFRNGLINNNIYSALVITITITTLIFILYSRYLLLENKIHLDKKITNTSNVIDNNRDNNNHND